jgi:glutamate dehydrogenase (NADP+)
VDVALPCATQNEINEQEAQTLLKNGLKVVCEGANMPAETGAANAFMEAKILYGPGKAANAGGVAVSGLEQSQNALRLSWSRDEVDARLQSIMHEIHKKCLEHGGNKDHVDYVKGANLGGFLKVADAMLAYGAV